MVDHTEITAYHEAGHAFFAIYLGGRIRSVSLDPDQDGGPYRLGDTQVEWHLDRFNEQEIHEREIQVSLAGPVTEMVYKGERGSLDFTQEWAGDWHVAWTAATKLFNTDEKRMSYLEQTATRLFQMISRDDFWEPIAGLADHLLAHETLEGEEVEGIVSNWLN